MLRLFRTYHSALGIFVSWTFYLLISWTLVSIATDQVAHLAEEATRDFPTLGDALNDADKFVGVGAVVVVDATDVEMSQAEGVDHRVAVGRGVDAIFAA